MCTTWWNCFASCSGSRRFVELSGLPTSTSYASYLPIWNGMDVSLLICLFVIGNEVCQDEGLQISQLYCDCACLEWDNLLSVGVTYIKSFYDWARLRVVKCLAGTCNFESSMAFVSRRKFVVWKWMLAVHLDWLFCFSFLSTWRKFV